MTERQISSFLICSSSTPSRTAVLAMRKLLTAEKPLKRSRVQVGREAVGVAECGRVGVDVGLGVDTAAEVERTGCSCRYRGEESESGFPAVYAAVIVGRLLQAHLGRMGHGVLHAVVESPDLGLLLGAGCGILEDAPFEGGVPEHLYIVCLSVGLGERDPAPAVLRCCLPEYIFHTRLYFDFLCPFLSSIIVPNFIIC